uniref:low-density lipoprotein receptor-related protein 6-like n=1 Tax=Styela clava TaxID=7725 RepID=UPI001939D268|nr:low-density lipoprotein receptor-related protein 6-like [Styela clava]
MVASFRWYIASAVLLFFIGAIFESAEANNDTSEDFDRDLIFWAMKRRIFFLHKTYAYFTDPNQNSNDSTELNKKLLFQSLWNGEIWAIAADYHAKRLYYSDHAGNFIGVYDLKTKEHKKVFQGMAWGIDSLSVDWVSGNVYWTDSNFKWIMVANRNFSHYRNLFSIDSEIPAKVAVDPPDRYIYWTEKREDDCRIWRSSLEGYSHQLLHTFPEVQTISDVAIDFVNHRFYWTERLKERGGISRIRYFGLKTRRDIETIHEVYSTNSSYFFGLASYKNNLYVTDDLRKSMFLIDKNTNEIVQSYDFDYSQIPRGVTVFSKYEQPFSEEDKTHECTKSPCQHICVARYGINQYSCECRTGFRIQSDGRSCRASMIFDNFVLMLDGKHSKIYQMNMGSPIAPQEVEVQNLRMPTSVAYDPNTKLVYWADERTRTVSRADLFGRYQTVLVNESQVYSVALDVDSQNMYWVDSERDAMYVSKLDGSYPHMLHVQDLHRVWAMTIDTKRGFLYWSDWGQLSFSGLQSGVISSSRLDGSDKKVIVQSKSTPHGLSLDIEGNVLYWTEIKENAIGWLNLNDQTNGKYKMPSTKKRPFPTGIAYYQNYLYVSDMGSKNLVRVSVHDVMRSKNNTGTTDEVRQFGPQMFYQLSALYVYDSSTFHNGKSPCAESNCPHLCLPVHTSSDVTYKCVCQNHYEYISANNSCVQVASTNDNEAPDFGDTCPDDIKIQTDECSDEAELNFTVPNPTDNLGQPVTLRSFYNMEPPVKLKEGFYTFSYNAMDGSGNRATCTFRVNVVVRNCYSILLKSSTPSEAVLGKPSCGNKVGSLINVTCPEISGIAFQYECQEDSRWAVIGPESCDEEVRAAYTTPTPTTSALSTTFSTVKATTVLKKATTRKPSSRSSTTMTASISPVPRIDDLKTTAMNKGESTTKSIKEPSHAPGTGAKSKTGLIVGLVIALIVLCAVVAAIVVVIKRRKGKGFIPGTNWDRNADRVQLTGASTESGIYLGDTPQELPVFSPASDKLIL